MKTKKTLLFIAAVFGGIMATSLTACGDESTEDIPDVPKDTTENHEKSPDLTKIQIKDNPSETLEYVAKIGGDFETALDSLRKLKGISSEINKKPLEVLFDSDDRLFFGIIYGDCGMYSDVLDTRGNYYHRTWYADDNSQREIRAIPTSKGGDSGSSNKCFDLSGRRVTNGSGLPKGIYIENGRKRKLIDK